MPGQGEPITTKFKVDISDLKKGISEANRNMKLANAQFKAASSGMNDWTKSSEGITAKLKQLSSVLNEQNTKLKAYQQQQQRIDSAYSKNKAKADELKAAMAQLASQGVSKTSAEYQKYEKALTQVEKEAAANKKASEDLKVTILNQQAAINRTTQEQKKYESELKNVEQAEKAAAKSGKSVEEELKNLESQAGDTTESMGKLAGGIKGGLAAAAKVGAAALAAAGAAVVALTKEAITSYAEYEQLVGGVDTLFGKASGKVQEYAANAYKTAGMSANEYMETVTGFSASLLQSLGGDTAKAADVADMALTDMSDNANKMGTSMEMIKNAYGGFAKQNFTMLDNLKLGYGGTKTEMERLLKDAEKLSGQKYDISSLNDVYEAIHVVQQEMGITGTTAKEAATTIQGSVGMMKASWSNLMTGMADDTQDFDQLLTNFIESLGSVISNVLPRVQIVMSSIFKLVEGLLPEIPPLIDQLLPEIVKGATTLIQGVLNALPQLLDSIIQVLPQLTQAILGLLPQLVTVAAQLVQAILIGLGTMLPEIVNQIIEIVPQIVQALADGIPLIIDGALQLLMGIIQAIPTIVQNLSVALPQIITSICQVLTQSVPLLLQAAIQLLDALVQAIPVIIPQMVAAIPQIVESLVTGLVGALPLLLNGALDLLMAIVEAIPLIIPPLAAATPQIFMAIIDTLSANAPLLVQAAIDLFMGIVKAIPQIVVALAKAIPQLISGIVKGIVGGYASVAKAALNLGKQLFKSFINAVSSLPAKGKGIFVDFASKVIEALKNLPSKIATTLGFVIGKVARFGVDLVKSAKTEIPKFVNSVITFMKELPSKIPTILSSVLTKVTSWGTQMVSKAKDAGSKVVTGLVNAMKNLPSKMTDIGKYAVEGIWKGISNAKQWIIDKIKGFAGGVVKGFKDAFVIKSPSRVMRDQVGIYIAQGIAKGIDKGTKSVTDSVKKLADATVSAAKSTFASSGFDTVSKNVINGSKKSIDDFVKNSTTSVKNLVNKSIDSYSKSMDKKIKAINKNVQKQTNAINADKKLSAAQKTSRINKIKDGAKSEIAQLKKNQDNYKKAGQASVKAYTDALKDFSTNAKAAISAAMTEVNAEFEEKYKTLAASQKSLQDKLFGFGDLYTMNDNGTMTINNLKDQTAAITKYANDLNKIKGKVSSELFDAISNMSVEEGQKYVNKLFAMSDKELKAYNAAYTQKLNAAKSLSEKVYQKDLQDLNTQYNNAVDKALGGLANKLKTLGEQAMNGFTKGMKSETKNMSKEIKTIADTIVKQFKKQLKIKSPSRVFADEIGKFIPSGIALGIEDNAKALMSAVNGLTSKAVGLSQDMLSDMQVPTLAAAGVGSTTTSTSVVNNFNQTINAPKQPSRIELYRQTKNLLNLKGGA